MSIHFDFLQIHDDRPLTKWEIECIAQLKNLLLEIDCRIPVSATYTMLNIPHFENIVDTVNYSDRARFEWLSAHPSGVYVDTDCFLKEVFIPSVNNIPFLARNARAGDGVNVPDIFLIYVNGATNWIQENFNIVNRDAYLINNVVPEKRGDFYGWPLTLCKEMRGYEFIPESVYIHNYQTMNAELIKRRSQVTRHVNDIVNEHLVAMDSTRQADKQMILQLRDTVNLQADKIEKLTNEINDFKTKMIELRNS